MSGNLNPHFGACIELELQPVSKQKCGSGQIRVVKHC